MCFTFIYNFCQNIFRSDKYLSSYASDASRNACIVVIKIVLPQWK
jgi:hypothetical protein